MALHSSVPSMLKESLVEMFLVAKYSVEFRKDFTVWNSYGCYGYPAAILLFSIADSIGSYVIGGKPRGHFNILNDKNYYNLNLSQKDIEDIFKKYRSLLVHNGVMANGVLLDIGDESSPIIEKREGVTCLNLVPFLITTHGVLLKFLEDSDSIVNNSKQWSNTK